VSHPDASVNDTEQSVPDDGSAAGEPETPQRGEYRRPGLVSDRPRFDPTVVRELVEKLGESWNDESYQACLRAYDRDRRIFAILRALGLFALLFLFMSVMNRGVELELRHASGMDQFLVVAPGLATVVAIYLVAVVVSRNVGHARMRFFRHLGKAIDNVWQATRERSVDIDLLYVLNRLGVASRALFLALQGSRRTWKAPPMVADRATTLASALIDFDIPDDLHLKDARSRDALHRFLHDVAAVVVIGREDLLPRVRETYHELPVRSATDETKRERDMTYLNPMRDRSRWDVAKDFWYPLAPWLSLFVAIAALVISLRR
jgi:hypothetical protein